MKKISKILMMCLVVLGLGFTLTACAPTIVSAVVKNGTLETTVVKDENVDTSNVIAIFKYSDNKVVEVNAEDLTFGDVDTSTTGTKKLAITYNDFTFYVDIIVVVESGSDIKIASFESELLTQFNSNRAEKTNKQIEFFDRNQPLYVGDDNAFDFRIKANGIDKDGRPVLDVKNPRTKITVELKNENDFTLLEDEVLTQMVEINKTATTFDFTEQSIGKTFRITVKALDVADGYSGSSMQFVAEVLIVDGFNVYNAKELSVYDNTNDYSLIKQSLNLTDVKVNGIVLQNDIAITKDDACSDLFYTKNHPNYSTASSLTNLEVDGTPIDNAGKGVYHRVFANNETFNFIGNYFTIDVSRFPKMVVEGTSDLKKGVDTTSGGFMTSHFSLFYNTDGSESTDRSSQLNIKNVNFFGNGALNGDVVNSGSIILMKNTRVNTKISNTITHNFYIGYFFQKGGNGNLINGEYEVESCKGYNSYQSLFYMSGAKHVLIKNSEYKGAGGPAIIADHVEPDKNGKNGWPTSIDIVNSVIESIVSGQEPWFAGYGAGGVVQALAQLDQFFDASVLPPTGKTVIASTETVNDNPVHKMNLMVLLKEKGAKISSTRISGYVRIFESVDAYEKYYGLNGQTQQKTAYGLDLETDGDLADKAIAQNVSYIQSAKSGGYINQNYAQNYDASIVGTTKAIGIATALKISNFNNLPLENQKAILKQYVSNMNETNLQKVYDGCVAQKALDEVENWSELSLADKQTAINNQIDTFENVSYAEGNYLNVYAGTGMGLLMQIYDK